MEFLILVIVFICAYLVGFKPEKQRLAHILLCVGIGLSMFVWLMGTWGQLVPSGNL